MANLIVVFDPYDPPLKMSPHVPANIRMAQLSIADDLDDIDIYAVAQKLAELLLEQMKARSRG